MIGIGIVATFFNLLPVAYFLLSPFAMGRGNLSGNRRGSFHRGYYRRLWQRVLFGKHLYLTIPALGTTYIVNYFGQKEKRELYSNLFYANIEPINQDYYDEEASSTAKSALAIYKSQKVLEKTYQKYENIKGESNYKLMSEAFTQYKA